MMEFINKVRSFVLQSLNILVFVILALMVVGLPILGGLVNGFGGFLGGLISGAIGGVIYSGMIWLFIEMNENLKAIRKELEKK